MTCVCLYHPPFVTQTEFLVKCDPSVSMTVSDFNFSSCFVLNLKGTENIFDHFTKVWFLSSCLVL